MKIVITGADGQLGQTLSNVLSQSSFDILNLTRSQLDITNQKNIEEMVDKYEPEWIINTAAYTRVDDAESNKDEAFLINSTGPKLLAEASDKHTIKLIQISTDYVFEGISDVPYGEYDLKMPKTIYGASKSEGEDSIMNAMESDYYIVRTSWLYSDVKNNFAKFMVRKALNSQANVEVVNDQFGQPTFAGDLARQIERLIKARPAHGIYHGTNSGRTTWFEFAQEIFRLVGEKQNRVIGIKSSELERKTPRPSNSALSHIQWRLNGMPEMRNWREALVESMPGIVASVEKESRSEWK